MAKACKMIQYEVWGHLPQSKQGLTLRRSKTLVPFLEGQAKVLALLYTSSSADVVCYEQYWWLYKVDIFFFLLQLMEYCIIGTYMNCDVVCKDNNEVLEYSPLIRLISFGDISRSWPSCTIICFLTFWYLAWFQWVWFSRILNDKRLTMLKVLSDTRNIYLTVCTRIPTPFRNDSSFWTIGDPQGRLRAGRQRDSMTAVRLII